MPSSRPTGTPLLAWWSDRGETGEATLLNLIGLGLPSVLALLTIPALVRGLGERDFGLFSLAWAVTGYFTILDFGISRAASRAVAREQGQLGSALSVLRAALRLQGLIGLVAGLALAAGASEVVRLLRVTPESVGAAESAVRWLAVGLPVTLVASVFNGAFEGLRLFAPLNVVRVLSSSLLLILPVVSLATDTGVLGAVAALVVARGAGVLVAWVVLRRRFRGVTSSGVPVDVGALYRYGGWLTVSGIATPLLTQSDRFVIGRVIGLTAVAAYAAPLDVVNRLAILPAALVSALFPRLSAMIAAGDHAGVRSLVWTWTLRLSVVLGTVVGVAIPMVPNLLAWWLGPSLAATASLATQLMLVATFINGVAWVPTSYFQAAGRPDIPAWSHLVQVPLYFLVVLALTQRFGLVGAAMAAIMRASVDTGFLFVVFRLRTCRYGAP